MGFTPTTFLEVDIFWNFKPFSLQALVRGMFSFVNF